MDLDSTAVPSAGRGLPDFDTAARVLLQDLHSRVGLDSWLVARRTGSQYVLLSAVDDVLGLEPGDTMPWSGTFCARMVEGGPMVVPNVDAEPAYRLTRDRAGLPTRAVISVPIPAPDGQLLGTLCAHGMQSAGAALHEHLPTVRVAADVLGLLLHHELVLGEQVRRAERAESVATTDPLTGCGNRRAWDAALASEEARAARYASPVSLVVLDLDGLKRTNDTAGHEAGDELLRRTSGQLRQRLRAGDLLARLGGDEFGLLLPDTDAAGATVLARRLGVQLGASGVSVSIGTAERQPVPGGLPLAWQEADAAMYADKQVRRSSPAPAPQVVRPVSPARRDPPPTTTSSTGVDALLRIARDQLGMEVAFISEQLGAEQRRFRNVQALPLADAPLSGQVTPTGGTYCRALLSGQLDEVVPDAGADDTARSLDPGFRVGAHVGVAMHRRDGRLYGSLCAYANHPQAALRPRDAEILRILAPVLMELVESEDAVAVSHHEILQRLTDLDKAGGLQVVYQPIRALDSMEQVGVEALARFPAGTPGPAHWFSAAKAAGVGEELELAAVRAALTALPDVKGLLAVNVSPEFAQSPTFARELAAALPDDDRALRLVLELTEHDEIEDYRALASALAPLRERGVRIAVDDTGAGFASMRHVLALMPDLIKLDISLVRGIDTDVSRQALAAALTAFADRTGAQMVAEGIERQAELDVVRSLNVTYGQGYLLGAPAALPTV